MHAPQCHTDGMYESITIFYNSWWPLVIASIKLSNDIMHSPVASQSRVVAKYAQRRWGNKTPGETYSVTMTCKLNHVRYLGICVRGNTDIFVRGNNKLGETRTPATPGAGFSFIFRSATDSSYMAWNFNHTNSRDMCVSKAFRITRVATICMVKIPCHIRRSYSEPNSFEWSCINIRLAHVYDLQRWRGGEK